MPDSRARRKASSMPRNTVGCGDALLAGFLDARARRLNEVDALAHAVAVGTAAALQEAVGVVDTADVARLLPGVCMTVKPPGPDEANSNDRGKNSAFVISGLNANRCQI